MLARWALSCYRRAADRRLLLCCTFESLEHGGRDGFRADDGLDRDVESGDVPTGGHLYPLVAVPEVVAFVNFAGAVLV